MARKLRSMELRAGAKPSPAARGSAYDYNIPAKGAAERERVEAAEGGYLRLTESWRQKGRAKPVEKPA